jgi:hypothetical protein
LTDRVESRVDHPAERKRFTDDPQGVVFIKPVGGRQAPIGQLAERRAQQDLVGLDVDQVSNQPRSELLRSQRQHDNRDRKDDAGNGNHRTRNGRSVRAPSCPPLYIH